ncbi:hypothetical protein HX744_30420 [Pseudonocardia sp. ICBG1122]|nr:hypothetical protein [Pseudonocardia pini]
MRLFTALWPPPGAVAALTRALGGAPSPLPDGARRADPSTWHVTPVRRGPGRTARTSPWPGGTGAAGT